VLLSLLPLVAVIFCTMVTTNVKLPAPNARSELTFVFPVETC
jgi:hypothetical protein